MKRIRKVEVKIVRLDGQARFITKAPPGKQFTSDGIDQILSQHAANIEKALPGRDFRLVRLAGGANFNFVEIPSSECATQS